jgi:hypothetical protein
MPIVEGCLETISDTVFDSGYLRSARLNLFCCPVGQFDITHPYHEKMKQLEDTNMVQAGHLPPPTKFMIERWTCALFRNDRPVSLDDPIWQRVSLQLMVDMKIYARTSAFLIADSKCIFRNVDATNKEEIEAVLSKYPAAGIFADPISIETLQNFIVEVRTDDPDSSLKVLVSLVGTKLRAVQYKGI